MANEFHVVYIAGLEDTTETLCICDCKTENGTIISTQVLNPNFNN